ncbi:MAG: FtsX-like permease family protein [Prevotellaceae bacterium]|nr:FtsX-like permease family protein [Prevotellaceae bacterium]
MTESDDSIGQKINLKFAFFVARRYLFSKKTHNVINIISGISAAGVMVVSAALVCVLSIFNGFEALVGSLYSTFDPDLKIGPAKGKFFDFTDAKIQRVISFQEVAEYTEVVQDNALLRYGDKQMPSIVKGVSPRFEAMIQIDNIMYDGEFSLSDGAFENSVTGLGVAAMLRINPYYFMPLDIYAPKRSERVNMLRPDKSFNTVKTFVAGIFKVSQAQYDDNYTIISLPLARSLFEVDSTAVSAVEIQLKPNVSINKVKSQIKSVLGEDFVVKNRIEQQESYFRILNVERWIAFCILCFIVLIASFNIISSLSMLIIDKSDDIQTLKSMGANETLIRYIFLFEGWLIAVVGAAVGIIVGAALCLVQQHFGLLTIGEGAVVDSYPVVVRFSHIVLVFATVITIGFCSALYPATFAKNVKRDMKH